MSKPKKTHLAGYPKFLSAVVFLLLLMPPQPVSAEVGQCNGVWTNKPCDGGAKQVSEEKKSNTAESQAIREKSQKEVLVQDAKNAANRLSHDFGGIVPGLAELESYCLNERTSVEQCRTRCARVTNAANSKFKTASLNEDRSKIAKDRADWLENRRNTVENRDRTWGGGKKK